MTYLENNTKTTQTTEVSEELTIENCAGVKGKLDIKSGKSEQDTSTDNLFDNTWEQGLIDGATGNNEENTEFIRTGYIKIFPNCLYEISRSIYTSYMVFRFYDKNKKYLGNQTTEGIMTYSTSSGRMDVNEKSMTFTIINTNVAYMRVSDATNDLSTIYTMITNCPSPDYPSRIRNVGEDGSADFKKESGNIFNKNTDIELVGQFRNYSTGNIVTNTSYYGIKKKVKPNTTYISKYVQAGQFSNLCFFDKNMKYISGLAYNTENTIFTTPSNCKYITLAILKAAIYIYEFKEIQDVSFPFTEGQVLHKGDYLASDGIHQKRDTYIFTGTENWYKGNAPVEGTIHFYVGKSSSLKLICNCTHFVTTKTINGIALDNFMNFYPSTELGLTTVEQWKSYLAEQYANGTPVTIEYDLAEEIVIPYTPEQEEAYYELQHLLMYEGYTKIECIDEIKPDIQLTYWYNNELNKSYGERFDKVEDSINELEEEINNNNTKITTIESDINSLEANKLTSKGTNSTQGSWQSVPLDDNDHFVILVISGTNYTDWKILPKSLIKKYTPSSTLKIIHNGTTIVQIAWNANSMVEYIWTTGYTITHYTY